MRLTLLLPLLAAVTARPQTSESPASPTEWKPIETDSQRLRTDNQETRTYKASDTALKESVQQLTNQLSKPNRTEFTMDTRTPPKIKFQQKNMERRKSEAIENSHPGVAVPIDLDSFYESSTQKRPIIYRSETKTPTPDSGISTWILLSGQSTTSKPVRKQPTIKTTTVATAPEANKTTIMTEKPVKGTIKIKPLSTRKLKTTTPLPTTTKTTVITTTVAAKSTTTESPKTTEKNNRLMTKVKASVLNNAVKNKTTTTTTTTMSTTVAPTTTTVTTTAVTAKQKTDKPIIIESETNNNTVSENNETNDLQPEAKDGAIELLEKSAATTKRPRRPTNNKRKKTNNKIRRRKPSNTTASEKIDTAVGNITKPSKEKPIGTQLYNYLSREIMPTVGVGLVGLMVTAGLASYFFYPFGGLRRTFDSATDRKDYYYDEYAAGGMAEEELIGKVIAGMPEHDYSPSNAYRTHLARKDANKNDINYNYRNTDSYYSYPNPNDYQTVSVGSKIGYGRDVVAEHQKETEYSVDDGELEKNQFVVGSIPKEFEPIAEVVPEHGPRSLRMRRRAQNDAENEIIDFKYEAANDKTKYVTVQPYFRQKITTESTSDSTTDSTEITTTESTVLLQPEQPNIFSFIRNLLELKVRVGLDFLLRTTDSFSNYLRGVQNRVNHALREENNRAPPR